MKTEINEFGNLVISIDTDEQKELKLLMEDSEYPQSDEFMYEYMGQLTCNSEWEWIEPEEIGALTDAPILGIKRYHEEQGYELPEYTIEVVAAYGFMDYQVISLQEQLLRTGEAVLMRG